jgi:tRNA(fMet)-specific endonuclease VapC
MKFLLDTNPCIVYLNARSSALRQRLDAEGDSNIAVCSIVLAELYYGATKSSAPEKALLKQLGFISRFKCLPFDDNAAGIYGPIRAELERSGATIGAHDLLIASISLANDLILVSHNTREFRRISGLKVDDWQTDDVNI